jgi:FSR family fosmidomycin resistance protein-like MFS transporter
MSLIGVAPNYGVLLLLLFVSGISIAVFHVPAPVMVSRLSGAKVGRGMSFFMTGGEFSRTVGPLVAVGAVSLLSLEGFYPVMTFGIATSFWLYVKFKDVPITRQDKKKTRVSDTWLEMRHVLWPLTAILMARGFMHASMATFLPTYLKAETGNLWIAGLGLTIYEATGVVGAMTSGSISDYLGRRKVLLIALVGAPLSLFAFSWFGGWFRFVALLFAGFTILSPTPVMLALVQENAPKSPAAANGFFMMVSSLARSAIVVLVGFVADHIGLQATYFFSAAMGLVGIPFIFRLPKGKTWGHRN